jgi:hypothetical protein
VYSQVCFEYWDTSGALVFGYYNLKEEKCGNSTSNYPSFYNEEKDAYLMHDPNVYSSVDGGGRDWEIATGNCDVYGLRAVGTGGFAPYINSTGGLAPEQDAWHCGHRDFAYVGDLVINEQYSSSSEFSCDM